MDCRPEELQQSSTVSCLGRFPRRGTRRGPGGDRGRERRWDPGMLADNPLRMCADFCLLFLGQSH